MGVPPPGAPLVAADMPHMAQFVYDMYMDRLRTGEVHQRQQRDAEHRQQQQQQQAQVGGRRMYWWTEITCGLTVGGMVGAPAGR